MTVLLSFEEKTYDAHACAQSGHCPFKNINSKNVVIHSENCKVEIPLDITAQQLSKKICRMTGI